MEMFGQDFENFEAHEEEADDEPAVETSNSSAPRIDKGKKGKLASKSTGHTYQFQIMESIDVPRSEVKKFADPYHWLTYFPPIAMVSPSLFIPCAYRPSAFSGGQSCLGDTRRLASFVYDDASKPLLRFIRTLADEQIIRIREDQVWRAIYYL
jgi:hypothetical protein